MSWPQFTRTAEHRARISAALKGRPKSPEAKARMAAAARSRAERPEERARLSVCGAMGGEANKGRTHSEQTKKKWSAAHLGKEPHWPRDKRVEHGGIRMRSTWEVRAAKAMDALGIRWEYEPTRFHFGDQTYRPDFFLPDAGAYWEVKGYFAPRAQRAVRLFRRMRDEPLVVINEAALLMLERAALSAAGRS